MRFLIAAMLLFSSCAPACAQLVYRGEQTIYEDSLWEGEVRIDGILTVAPEVRLEIRPGTRVLFTRIDTDGDGLGESELFIQGILAARGTAEAPILFSSAELHPVSGDWGAINMMATTEPGILSHCVVEYATRGFHAHFAEASIESSLFRHNYQAIQFQDARVTLENLVIENNRNALQFRDSEAILRDLLIRDNLWAMRSLYGTIRMERTQILGNRLNGLNLRESYLEAEESLFAGNRRGLYLQDSEARLEACRFENNLEHGVLLENSIVSGRANSLSGNGRSGLRFVDSRGELHQGAILDNGIHSIFNEGATDADLRFNWWGSLDAARIGADILDGEDRPGLGLVRIEPILEQNPLHRIDSIIHIRPDGP